MRAGAAPDRHRVAGMLSLRWRREGRCDQAFGQARQVLSDNRLTCTIYTLGSPLGTQSMVNRGRRHLGDMAIAPITFLLCP